MKKSFFYTHEKHVHAAIGLWIPPPPPMTVSRVTLRVKNDDTEGDYSVGAVLNIAPRLNNRSSANFKFAGRLSRLDNFNLKPGKGKLNRLRDSKTWLG